MQVKSFSNPLAVIATLLIFVFVMFIVMTATTEADNGFQQSEEEQMGMTEYYTNCPFKKAEKEDISSQHSIRNQVKFTDVSCDQENHVERVKVELIGENKEQSLKAFENWLKSNGLKENDSLKISFTE